MATKISNENIEKYYNENQIIIEMLCNLLWPQNALHYGLWDKNTKKLSDAVLNTNKLVLNCLEINPKDFVLDAGCGIGGTSIFIAENSGAKVTGITLSDVQLKLAKEKALKSKVSKLLDFSKQDFTKTQFKNKTFSKIFGIESICHAHKKIDFLREANRIMKPCGKIAVVDAYLKRTNFNEKEKKIYQRFLEGWAVPNLSLKKDFYNDLKKAGFKNIVFHDKLDSVRKSSRRIYHLGIIIYPITLLLSLLKIIPKSEHLDTVASINQKGLVDNDMVTYGIFVAEK